MNSRENRLNPNNVVAFRKKVWAKYKTHGRHDLTWRKTRDPYVILVSEVMLQQTQVERVKFFFERFMKKYPTVFALSRSSLATVFTYWQGLGYNRRAKMLLEAAQEVVEKHHGVFPKDRALLEKLPGIGPYTASAVLAFAFNEDTTLLETNIRTAILHDFFSGTTKTNTQKIADAEIQNVLEKVLVKGKSRKWNLALMDYGTFLKKSGIKLNTKSKHYVAQKPFVGSLREVRGAILRALAERAGSEKKLLQLFDDTRGEQVSKAITALEREGLIRKRGRTYVLPR